MKATYKVIFGSLLLLGLTAHGEVNITKNCDDGVGSSLMIIQLPDDGVEKNRPASYKDVRILLKGPAAKYLGSNETLEIDAIVDSANYSTFGLAETGGSRYSATFKVINHYTGVMIFSFENGTPIENGISWYFGNCR